MTSYVYGCCTLRIYAGVLWLLYGTSKLAGWLFNSSEFVKTTRDTIKGTSGSFHDFVADFVIPHAALFAHLIPLGETLCGVNYRLTGGQYVSYWGPTA